MKRDRRMLALLLILMLLPLMPLRASANAAEPPSVTILVSNAPEDLQITVENMDDAAVRVRHRAWETYFRLYMEGIPDENVELLVENGGESFICHLPEETYQYYSNVVTLDLDAQTLIFGQPFWRTPLLVGLRLTLTLLIEGAVFYLLGYRSRGSWIFFLILNLITQGWLNLSITGPDPSGYYMMGYYLMEVLIFASEMVFFALLGREKTAFKRMGCAFAANAASLVLGGMLLTYLPI